MQVSLHVNCILLAPDTTLWVVSLDLTLDRHGMPHVALFHVSLELRPTVDAIRSAMLNVAGNLLTERSLF